MPGFDRRGPEGMGPMTGGGRGRCSPYGGRANRQSFGQQVGWGGRGRGWHHWRQGYGSPRWGWGRLQGRQRHYYETFDTRDEEMALLKEEAAVLKGELEAIEQRLSEIETCQQG
jgi:hypothetical protein